MTNYFYHNMRPIKDFEEIRRIRAKVISFEKNKSNRISIKTYMLDAIILCLIDYIYKMEKRND